MDWPKIKTILILVLVATNIMLGYTYIREQQRFEAERENNLEDVLELYKNKGVELSQTKLKFPKSVSSVNIEFVTFDLSFVEAFLGSDYSFDGKVFVSDNHQLYLDNTHLFYSDSAHYNRIIKADLGNLEQFNLITDLAIRAELKSKIDVFLGQVKYELKYSDFDVVKSGNYTLVKLHQMHDEMLFVESKTVIWFYNDEIVGFRGEDDVKITATPGFKYDIISVDRILYGLLPKLNDNDKIKSISLIYKLNDESLLVSDLVLGEALPYYQIVLSNGDVFQVRAVNEINK
ncbi:two-component system regulatory protein YycI [Fusibacter bizertensis]